MATALPSGWGQEMVSVIEQTTPSARSKEREHCSIARTPLLRQGGECCFPRDGLLEPLDKIELPEGKEVTVIVFGLPENTDIDAFRRSAGSWKGSMDANKLIRNIYADRLIATSPKPRL